MRIAARMFVVVCVVTLSGCTTAPERALQQKQEQESITDVEAFTCAGACTDKEASRAMTYAFKRCRDTQNLYERRGFNSKTGQLAVAVVGALAGAVAAPIAKGSATKAWSGLSGATNGIQTQLADQFSATIIAQERLAVSDAMVRGEVNLRAVEPDAPKEVFEARIMAYECTMAAATADAAVTTAISSAAQQAADSHQKVAKATQEQISSAKATPPPASGGSSPPPAQPSVNPTQDGHQ